MFIYISKTMPFVPVLDTRPGKIKAEDMEESILVSPFSTTLFFRPQLGESTTANLWKEISKEDGRRLKLDDVGADAIYNVPEDAVIVDSVKLDNCVSFTCVANFGVQVESIIGIALPIENNFTPGQYAQLTELAKEIKVEIVVSDSKVYPTNVSSKWYLFILGEQKNVVSVKSQILALLQLFQNKFVRHIALDTVSLLPICAGMNLSNLHNFENIYKTKVFLPSMLPEGANHIFLSGDIHSLTLLAQERLSKILDRAQASLLYSHQQNVSPLKLQYIKQFYSKQLLELMNDNQCFINITEDEVQFVSNSTSALERAMRSFTFNILTDVYEAQVLFHDSEDNVVEGDYLIPIQAIVSKKKVFITQLQPHLMNYVVVGKADGVVSAVNSITNFDSKKKVQVRYLIELHPDYKEFISGKKNGKLTRIMDIVDCQISLDLQGGEGNMVISLTTEHPEESKKAIRLLGDELPAEDAFFIPEAYHRPVIGTGGSVIQTIMRKHNVFIQFSNSFQYPQNDLGLVRYNNVVIRCPSKNKASISHARQELNHLVEEYSELQPKTLMRFSPGQYCHFVQGSIDWKANIIGDIERKTSTYIIFPFEKPSEGYNLEIRGNDGNSHLAAKELAKYFADEYEIHINAPVEDFEEFTNSIIVPLKKSMKMEVTFSNVLIRFTYCDLLDSQLTKAVTLVRDYLSPKGMKITSEQKVERNFILNNSDPPTKSPTNTSPVFVPYPYTYTNT